jgi:hypothetical protein
MYLAYIASLEGLYFALFLLVQTRMRASCRLLLILILILILVSSSADSASVRTGPDLNFFCIFIFHFLRTRFSARTNEEGSCGKPADLVLPDELQVFLGFWVQFGHA